MVRIAKLSIVAALAACHATPPVNPTPEPAACDDKIVAWSDRMFAVHGAYLDRLEAVRWLAACATSQADLDAVVVDAQRYIDDMRGLRAEIRADATCEQPFTDTSNADPRGPALAKRIELVFETARRTDERCDAIPRWRSTYDGALGAFGVI